MATINKIDLNGDTYDIESSGLVTTQPTNPSEGATYYDTVNDVVKVYDGTSWNPISGGGGSVAFATSSTAGNVAEKEVSVPSITTLNVGQILCIKPTASATVANLTIKLNNFTAYPIRYNNGAITTTTDDLVWSQNFVSQFVFDGTYRQFVSHGYDNNTTYTQNILFDRGGFVSGSGTYAITRYSICLQKPDMTWEKVTNTEKAHSVNADKTVNTHGFLLNGEMLYYSNTSVLANGAVSSSNTMYKQYSGFDIRYSANTSGTGYTAGDYIYFVGTIGVDGLFYLDATQWWTNTLPSTNDGKIYVKVGKYVSGVTVTFEIDHPAYYHDGTRIREYVNADNKQDKALVTTLNNADNNHYPTAKAVADAIQSAGGGDMMASTYDPNGVGANVYDYINFINTPTIPTKTSNLTNDSGFITSASVPTKTSDLTNDSGFITSSSLPTKVSDLTNDAGYITSSAIPTDYVKTSGNQTIAGTKTFSTSPVVPSKTTSATNTGTAIATEAQVYKKQDTISDLATIRSGASAGATALQSGDNVSELTNDAGYLTSSTGVTSVNGNHGDITIPSSGLEFKLLLENQTTTDVYIDLTPYNMILICFKTYGTRNYESSSFVMTSELTLNGAYNSIYGLRSTDTSITNASYKGTSLNSVGFSKGQSSGIKVYGISGISIS